MTTLREQILETDDLEEEVVDVPQWEAKVLIRGMDGKSRAKFLRSVTNKDGSGDVDIAKFYPSLIISTAYDPEAPDKPLFDQADRDALNGKSGAALDLLAKSAMRLSGLGTDALDKAVEDLKETQNGDST